MRTRRKFLPWLETWELYPGVLEGHPGCSPCGWERRGFAASSLGAVAMGSAKSPDQPSFCPNFFCLLCLLWIITHLFLFTPLFQQKEGQERKELCNTIWAVSKCLVLIVTAPLGTETMFKCPFYSTRHSALQKKKSFVVLERKMRVAVSCTDPISSR